MDGAHHGHMVSGLFGRIARWYDFLNHFLSLGLDLVWRRRLVERTLESAPSVILDLAAGTLDVAVALSKRSSQIRVTAADFCLPMLLQGQGKIKGSLSNRVHCVCADGRRLPFASERFSAVTIAFGIRNILPRSESYAEVLRVLSPGGRFLILEFASGKKRILGGLYNLYLHWILPAVGRLFSGDKGAYRYLADTIREFPEAEALAEELQRAGFARVTHERLSGGIVCLHVAVKPAEIAQGETVTNGESIRVFGPEK